MSGPFGHTNKLRLKPSFKKGSTNSSISTGSTGYDKSNNHKTLTKGNNYHRTVSRDGRDTIIIKGGTSDTPNGLQDYTIDLDEVRKTLRNLKENHAVFISSLGGDLHERFMNIRDLIDIMKTSGAYKFIDEIINEVFADVKSVTPGTIGSYLIGCNIANDFKGEAGCSATCVGSVQNTDIPGVSECKKLALLYDNDKTFTAINNPEFKEDALVYVNSKEVFKGFSRDDIKRLQSFGVKRIKVVKYSDDGSKYTEVFVEHLPLTNLVPRDVNVPIGSSVPNGPNGPNGPDVPSGPSGPNVPSGPGGSSGSGNTFLTVIFVILVILFIGYLFYSLYYNKSSVPSSW